MRFSSRESQVESSRYRELKGEERGMNSYKVAAVATRITGMPLPRNGQSPEQASERVRGGP